ncbi:MULTISPECIES: fumarylacetoacetate hydrolase family protein [unclassified Fusibacter]|uniref:fumarylacetoacetate hydrolase family protein n=1 Tax=unclassified Fusibacter TaxID=2624464 RepID=UPI001012F99D|nr:MULTISPECIES: fumarylacetoacetate hydrolase family protein [unclassified Fusibacter]MCK8059383.1 fumarylacetoacetate hydrolase family protein [Fusibacter sp. A2]NPE21153.1 fumarylacetoacetate hydrolase family protein [Fusibacter sp. A1]RXV62421.1 FAA hydrolase family protein [Fusibacter sp. A1]
MKFITYSINNKEHLGILSLDGTRVCEINAFLDTRFTDMTQLITEISDSELDLIAKKLETASESDGLPVTEVVLKAPIPYPIRPLFCLGKNYIDHALETKGLPGSDDEVPKHPIFFMKIAQPATATGDIIPNHRAITDMVDYEVELAVVIGKDGIDITKEDSLEHIFGYTIVNDISARNLQRKHSQWFKGKSLEGFSPMGPCIVHKSAFTHPLALKITCDVNGQRRQDSNTENLLFDIPTIIEELSKGMYLRAGDIILTGTPAGVGLGFTPFKFLKSGDKITCQIEGIGTLENTFE